MAGTEPRNPPGNLKDGKPWTEKVPGYEGAEGVFEVFYDKYPVTEGHLLFVPILSLYSDDNRRIATCFNAAFNHGQNEVLLGNWDGFNIGMNWGEAAGQTIAHPHIHLIPRRKGDMEDPRGGVRGVIPEKQKY